MNEIDRFGRAASSFCNWIDSAPGPADPEALAALEHLSNLYASGLRLSEAPTPDDSGERFCDATAHSKRIYERAKALPFQEYSEVFDPDTDPPGETVPHHLGDDLADSYHDVAAGLSLYENGLYLQASWHWRFYFWAHWGRHTVSAMRAIHGWQSTRVL